MCEVWRCFGDHSFITFSANVALNCFPILESGRLGIPSDPPGPIRAPCVCPFCLYLPVFCFLLCFPELLAFIYSGRCVPPDRNVLFIGRQKIHNFSKQTADMQTERRMQRSQTLAAFVSLRRSVVTEQRWQKIYREIIQTQC